MVTDILAKAYSDYFVEHFSDILTNGNIPDSPLISPIHYPHQNISGNTYQGTNQFFLQILSCKYGYPMPLWMTFNQMNELGIHPNKGTHSAKVGHFDYYVYDKSNKKKVDMGIDDYLKLTVEERKSRDLCLMNHSKYFNVFNISQTNFNSVYPNEYSELLTFFSGKENESLNNEILDTLVINQSWCCPIESSLNIGKKATYIEELDLIQINNKGLYRTDNAYYRDLLVAMARSTGSEMRLDRDIWSRLAVSVSAEGLLEELCANMMGAIIGIGILPQEDSLRNMKQWIEHINSDSSFIYNIMQEASKAAKFMITELGLNITTGIDLSNILNFLVENKLEKTSSEKVMHNKKVKLSHKR